MHLATGFLKDFQYLNEILINDILGEQRTGYNLVLRFEKLMNLVLKLPLQLIIL